MYMNGRGPMNRGFGPMGGPMHHRPMGFRPMGMWHRPMGFFPLGLFPLGGLFLLPALMFGGWIAIAVVGGVLSLVGTVIGGIFSGLASIASGVFSGEGIGLGIVIGLAAYVFFRGRKARKYAEAEEEE